MRHLYIDASVLLRIAFSRPGPRAPITASAIHASSELAVIEVSRALDQARLEGLFDDLTCARKARELDEMLGRITLFPLGSEMIALARSAFPVKVNVAHALHVATAQMVAREVGSLEFWTHVPEQGIAAMCRGFDVKGVKLQAS